VIAMEKERPEAERVETEAKEWPEQERQPPLERATKERPWVNSLGMKFVPVAGTQVLFSVWDTRVQDFEAFVADTNHDATGGMWSVARDGSKQRGATWREPGFSQGPTHPVVGVSWDDAKKFCEWLTGRERDSGILPQGWFYRLPTDAEWSIGVGLQREEGTNPKDKDRKIKLYPWGKEWPPPKGAGNYAGEESKIGEEPSNLVAIKGYNDGYPRTSPWEGLRQTRMGCMTWEGTSGNGAKTGMTRQCNTACHAVRRGTVSTATFCLLPVATIASLMLVPIASGFVVLWRLSLRGEAGFFL
jgi:hypothetical protein